MADPTRPAGRACARLLLTLLLLAGVGLAPATTGLAPQPAAAADAVVETALTVRGTPEADGTPVDLDVTLMTTDPAVARPAVVLAHGFGGTKDDSADVGRRLARSGYAVVTFTARGFGASGGLIHLNDPAFEGADAVRLVDLVADRPEVLSRNRDPVVGFAGASYGGAVSLLAAALDPRVDAIAPAFTWNSLVTALFPQSLAADGEPASLADVPAADAGVFKQRWASLFFLGGRGGGGGSGDGAGAGAGDREAGTALCGRFTAALCRGYLRTAESGRPDPDLVELLARSGPDRLLSRVTAPTLLLQGEQDTLFGLDQADANLRGLPVDTPARMEWVPGGHDAQVGIDDQLAPIEAWFARHLQQDGTPEDSTFTMAVPQTALVGGGDGDQDETRVLSLPGYPGRGGAVATQDLQLSGGPQTVLAPPGGVPAALTNLPGTGGALAQASSVGGYALGVLPGQSAVFTSEPLPEPLDLVGSGRVALRVTSSTGTATLFVSVWDVGPDATPTGGGSAPGQGSGAEPSSAVLPGRAVAPVRLTALTPGRPSSVTVALPAVAHAVPVGHRLRLVVSSTDQAYALPRGSAVYTVALGGDSSATGTLVLPRLDARVEGGEALRVPLALLLVVAGLAAAAAVAATVAWLRRRGRATRTDLRDVPLAVDGLVKTYRDGFRAVDGVSFTAGRGQVVGLLGPNGAGKTTTLRMLVGLIRPDSGAVFIGGRPVEAGAEVLGSVGALIEGPGFLPHLTGRQNLVAYWQATGRPAGEAQLEEALAVAGLGSALDRRVRGYSQGMRQRLGIAQAMLGRPDLLLLDEPTNGLDPPQILAMRTVLAEYAATGRTVLVSSHLLSEVEQTCTHVVVMNRGRVVLTGSVAELTAADDVTLVGLASGADRSAAEAALTQLGLAVDHQDGLLRIAGSRPRSELVAALVDAGVGVESVDGRRQLEEVFMGLVGAPPVDEPPSEPVEAPASEATPAAPPAGTDAPLASGSTAQQARTGAEPGAAGG